MRAYSLIALLAGASAWPSMMIEPQTGAEADRCAAGQALFAGTTPDAALTAVWGKSGWTARPGLLQLKRIVCGATSCSPTPFDPTTEAVVAGEQLQLVADEALEYSAGQAGFINRAWMAEAGTLEQGQDCGASGLLLDTDASGPTNTWTAPMTSGAVKLLLASGGPRALKHASAQALAHWSARVLEH